MSDWMLTYDGVFFISIATLITSILGISIRYCLKSKCEHFSLCFGLIKIDRRVDLEVQEELAQLEMGVTDDEPTTQQPVNQQPTQPVNQHQQLRPKRRPSNNESDDLENIALGTLNKI